MFYMLQLTTDLGRPSTMWAVYRDGVDFETGGAKVEVFRGTRKRCFNFINNGSPDIDTPPKPEPVETPPTELEVRACNQLRENRRESRRLRNVWN